MSAQGSRGFVVVAVLWMLAALAALASAYSVFAVNTAASVYLPEARLGADAAIRAAVELTAYRQLSWPKADRPRQGGFTARLGAARLDVAYRAETARVDVNVAPHDLLAGVFLVAGAKDQTAQYLADRIVAWRKPPQDQAEEIEEARIYHNARLSYAPVGAPFDNVLELALLPQMTPGLLARALPSLTVYSGVGTINPLIADPDVLAAVPGLTKKIVSALRDAAAGPKANSAKLSDAAGPAKDYVNVDPNDNLRAEIVVAFPDRRVKAEVVLLVTDSAEEPYQILYWRDDFDGAPAY